ncbi:hypothetical protein WOB88_01135, partial [Vibrio parahaemolyticus]
FSPCAKGIFIFALHKYSSLNANLAINRDKNSTSSLFETEQPGFQHLVTTMLKLDCADNLYNIHFEHLSG